MVTLNCPKCGEHLELALKATTSAHLEQDSLEEVKPTPTQAPSTPTESKPLPDSKHFRLKGKRIFVNPYKVIETVMAADPYNLEEIQRWSCSWTWEDGSHSRSYSIRGLLMLYLEAEHPGVNWKDSGVTTNDATRILQMCGFRIFDRYEGMMSQTGHTFRYPRQDGWR